MSTPDPLRAAIEHRARMQDALDALQQASLWIHRTTDVPRDPKAWDRKVRSGIVGLRAALAADTTTSAVIGWREFSARFMDPAYRDDPNRLHIRDAFAAGWDAALATKGTA